MTFLKRIQFIVYLFPKLIDLIIIIICFDVFNLAHHTLQLIILTVVSVYFNIIAIQTDGRTIIQINEKEVWLNEQPSQCRTVL